MSRGKIKPSKNNIWKMESKEQNKDLSAFNKYQELFEHMENEHGVILLESELQEIARLVAKDVLGQEERFDREMEQVKNDTELFADALNTIQKCNLYPSELYEISLQVNENSLKYKEQRDELIEWAETVINDSYSITRIKELINKIEG